MKVNNLLLKNVGRLVTMKPGKGEGKELGVIEKADLYIEDGVISWFGKRVEFGKLKKQGYEEVDLNFAIVTPGLIDCHTHLIHGGYRQNEFLQRSEGKDYWEIAKTGGGIMSTVRATRALSEDELYQVSLNRLNEAFENGITSMEVKSGYGLDIDTEIKILEVAKRLSEKCQVSIYPTYLGAHVVPAEYKDRRSDYVELVLELMPKVSKRGLCRACDVFVEDGAFSVDEARSIAKVGKKLGMDIHLHVDQFKNCGGASLAAELGALSADHLDYISDTGIDAMKKARVVAVLLPGATFFVGRKDYPPARKLLERGVRVAISTDYNPGTSPCLDLLLNGTIAATQMGMNLNEVWLAITINAAHALGIQNKVGSIAIGKRADLVVFDAPDEYYPLYRYGKNNIKFVIKSGHPIISKSARLNSKV